MLNQEEQKLEFQQVIHFLNIHKAKFFTVCFISLIFSVIVTFLIPKEYSSNAIIFPPASILLENSIENPNFGYDLEADRLLQIANSSEVRDSVIRKFNLVDYYKIDTTKKDWLYVLNKEYYKDIKFEKTQFMSVIITAQTEDPEMSTDIVNYQIEQINNFREKVYKQNIRLAYEKTKIEHKQEKIITDSLYKTLQNDIKALNISGLVLLAPNAQLNFTAEQLLSKQSNVSENLNLGSDILNYRHHLEILNSLDAKSKKLGNIIANPIAQVSVINHAETSYKKVFPSYTINAIIMMLLGFVATALVLVYKNNKN